MSNRYLRRTDGSIHSFNAVNAAKDQFTVITEEEMIEASKKPHVMEARIDEQAVVDIDVTTQLTREELVTRIKAARNVKDLQGLVEPYGITDLDGRRKLATLKKDVVKIVNDLQEDLFQ